MQGLGRDALALLQQETWRLRNICILAHVDHGKTTLSDYLVSSNGIISSKMAGRVRYLDSRVDEQERQITMKSSSIALLYRNLPDDQVYCINLIDSPGHVDFSSEVSNAVRFSDGALVLVDVIEGMCVQTQSVLQQAWSEGVKMCLVFNKMDRLITELKLTPVEAYHHIQQLLERINAFVSTFVVADAMRAHAADGHHVEVDESKKLVFSPTAGNVVFASSLDCWAFTVGTFASLYAAKMGMNEGALSKVLWGEYYFNAKTKTVSKKPPASAKGAIATAPMCVRMILDNIWRVYDTVLGETSTDKDAIDKIVSVLGIKVPRRELMSEEARPRLQAIFSRWLPIPAAVLGVVVSALPDPAHAQNERIERLWPAGVEHKGGSKALAQLVSGFRACDNKSPHVLVFVAKMLDLGRRASDHAAVVLDESRLDGQHQDHHAYVRGGAKGAVDNAEQEQEQDAVEEEKKEGEESEEEDRFLGFARVFCGTLDVRKESTQQVLVCKPNYDPNDDTTFAVVAASRLRAFMLMGRDVQELDTVSAGCVFGVSGVSAHLLNSGMLTTVRDAPPLKPMTFQSLPIVRVAVEPGRIADLARLTEGLRLLKQADPNLEVLVQESGEHVLVASGELHLERCLRDLKERFAPDVTVTVSAPIVQFLETLVVSDKTSNDDNDVDDDDDDDKEDEKKKDGPERALKSPVAAGETPNKQFEFRVRAVPLPKEARELLMAEEETLKGGDEEEVATVRQRLMDLLRGDAHDVAYWQERTADDDVTVLGFGPRRYGPNILVQLRSADAVAPADNPMLHNAVMNGFQLATSSGPLCGEPLAGTAFVIERLTCPDDDWRSNLGAVIPAFKNACHRAFMAGAVRLIEPVYLVHMQATADVLGRLYSVLGARRGKIVSEDMIEGSSYFLLKAHLPVAESFGFSKAVRKRTSGVASPQLLFSHWQLIEQDPFWSPTTEEELQEFGQLDKAVIPNLAHDMIVAVRKRKGLRVEEQVVEHAEKQRTLSRKK